MERVMASLRLFLLDEGGPTAVEYAVMIGIISAAVIVAMGSFGDKVQSIYVLIDESVDVPEVGGGGGTGAAGGP